jgi:hypothetical protein
VARLRCLETTLTYTTQPQGGCLPIETELLSTPTTVHPHPGSRRPHMDSTTCGHGKLSTDALPLA